MWRGIGGAGVLSTKLVCIFVMVIHGMEKARQGEEGCKFGDIP